MQHSESTWQSPPADLRLNEREVHLWLLEADRSDPEQLGALSEPEQLRARRLVQARARSQYVAAQYGLRAILGRYLGVPAEQVDFVRNEAGKPFLHSRHDSGLRFNLSHSGPWALVAVTAGREIGVDIEVHRQLDALALAERFFAPEEITQLSSLPEPVRQTRFFELWTAKEALVKAMGIGLAGTIGRFTIRIDGHSAEWTDRHDPLASQNWALQPLQAPAGSSATVAIAGACPTVCYLRAP